jgi:hydrogenase maturation protease
VKAQTVIVGVGSPFGDDRLGWAVADAVRESAWFRSLAPECVRVECLDRPGARLLAALDGARHAIIVDAMRSGAPPGTIRELALEALASSAGSTTSSHGFGLAEALRLGDVLSLLPPRLTILAVEADAAKDGDALSAEVRDAVQRILPCIEAHVRDAALVSGAGYCASASRSISR